MATNDFLVFGGGAGANVITQVTYSGLASRSSGFQSGVAQSAQLNKVWRQSSIMAAVLGQFISDLTGQDALDDGTTTTLLANLKAAISAQSVGIVGAVRNAKMSVTAASASATFTADEVIVESALGGKPYRLAGFSKTINLATTGAGGMDTGSAPTSGYVALYAIYNPTTGASALLARNATSAAQPEVYGGANMPAGYTASALVSVWGTNGSGQLKPGLQRDRKIGIVNSTALNTAVTQASPTALSIAALVPINAVAVGGAIGLSSSVTSSLTCNVTADANFIGTQSIATGTGTGIGNSANFELMIGSPQTLYYAWSSSAGTPALTITISSYQI